MRDSVPILPNLSAMCSRMGMYTSECYVFVCHAIDLEFSFTYPYRGSHEHGRSMSLACFDIINSPNN